jgi:membrane protease YdiL (CAAX protease family)
VSHRNASEARQAARPPDPPRVLLAAWAIAIAGVAAASALRTALSSAWLDVAGAAALLFVLVPDVRLRRRGDYWDDYGLPPLALRDPATWRAWGRGALAGLASCAVVLPTFALCFAAWFAWTHLHAPQVARGLAPDLGTAHVALRLPPGFPLQVVLQLLVVALPEELFYRGWMQTSWERGAPGRGVRVLGARLGAGFVWTQLLFAAGHLVQPDPWRLATFFPGLWFGWLRARTGSVVAGVVAHALSNLLLKVLAASFYGG